MESYEGIELDDFKTLRTGLISLESFYFNIGIESSETFEVIQKNFSSSGPRKSVHVGAHNNFAISCPN